MIIEHRHKIKEEIKRAFYQYVKVYFTERDFEKTKQLFHEKFTVIGSGVDEISYSFNKSIELFQRDFSQLSSELEFEEKNILIEILSKTSGMLMCDFKLSTKLDSQKIEYYHPRLSMVFTKQKDDWEILHLHISVPNEEQEENESYPIKKLEKQNRLLEQKIKERTAELEKHRDNLEELVKKRTKELESKNKDLNDYCQELKRYNKLMVGREFRVKELRDRVDELEAKLKEQ